MANSQINIDEATMTKYVSFTSTSDISVQEAEFTALKAIAKNDLVNFSIPNVNGKNYMSEFPLTDSSDKVDLQINNTMLELDNTFGVFVNHVPGTEIVNTLQTTSNSDLGEINNNQLLKTISVNPESASLYNSHLIATFTDGSNVLQNTGLGGFQLEIDETNAAQGERNAFKAVNHRLARLGVTGDEVHGISVQEHTEFNSSYAYLTDKKVVRDPSNGRLGVTEYDATSEYPDVDETVFNDGDWPYLNGNVKNYDISFSELPTDGMKPVIEGSMKLVQDPSGVDITVKIDGSAVGSAALSTFNFVNGVNNANLPSSLTQAEFEAHFRPEVLAMIGDDIQFELTGYEGGGYSSSNTELIEVDDSSLTRNAKYMDLMRVYGNNFSSAPHTIEVTNGDVVKVPNTPGAIRDNADLVTLTDEREVLSNPAVFSNGLVSIVATSHSQETPEGHVSSRWASVSDPSNNLVDLNGLEVTYSSAYEWDLGNEVHRDDLAEDYKNYSDVKFEAKILVNNTRDSEINDINGVFQNNNTYAREDASGNGLIQADVKREHIGKHSNIAAVLSGPSNLLAGTDLQWLPAPNVPDLSALDSYLGMVSIKRTKFLMQLESLLDSEGQPVLNAQSGQPGIIANAQATNLDISVFGGTDLRIAVRPRLVSELSNVAVWANEATAGTFVSSDPCGNLVTNKSSTIPTMMGVDANAAITYSDNFDININVNFQTADQTSYDYVKNSVLFTYDVRQGVALPVISGTSLLDETQLTYLNVVADPEVVETVSTGVTWVAGAPTNLTLKKKTLSRLQNVSFPFRYGAYSNLSLQSPQHRQTDTVYYVVNSSGQILPDSYLSYARLNGQVISHTRRFSVDNTEYENLTVFSNTVSFKPRTLRGFFARLEKLTMEGDWVHIGNERAVDIAHDLSSNLTDALELLTQEQLNQLASLGQQGVSLSLDSQLDTPIGSSDQNFPFYVNLLISVGNDSFEVEAKKWDLTQVSQLDTTNWSGVYSSQLPAGGEVVEGVSVVVVPEEQPIGDPIMNVEVYFGEALVGTLRTPYNIVADVNLIRSVGTVIKSSEVLSKHKSLTSTVDDDSVSKQTLVMGGINEARLGPGVRVWFSPIAQRGQLRKYRLKGDRVGVSLFNGYLGSLSAGTGQELQWGSALVSGAPVKERGYSGLVAYNGNDVSTDAATIARKVTLSHYRGYQRVQPIVNGGIGGANVNTVGQEDIVLQRSETTAVFRVSMPGGNKYEFDMGTCYWIRTTGGSSSVLTRVAGSGFPGAVEISSTLNLLVSTRFSMLKSNDPTSIPIDLSFARIGLRVSNPNGDQSLNYNNQNLSAASFSGPAKQLLGEEFQNGNRYILSRIKVYNSATESYQLRLGVPDLKVFYSPNYVGDIRYNTDWTLAKTISHAELRANTAYLPLNAEIGAPDSVLRIHRLRFNVQPHVKYITFPSLQIAVRVVGRNSVTDLPYVVNENQYKTFWCDCLDSNEISLGHINGAARLEVLHDVAPAYSVDVCPMTLRQTGINGQFKRSLYFRLTPDSTRKYVNVKSNVVNIKMRTGFASPPSIISGSQVGPTIYDGLVENLANNVTDYFKAELSAAAPDDRKFRLNITQVLGQYLPDGDPIPTAELENLMNYNLNGQLYNIIIDGIMPHMQGTHFLNLYAGDSVEWGVLGNQLRYENGEIVLTFVKYVSDYGADVDNYLAISANRNLMLVTKDRYTFEVRIPRPVLTTDPYDVQTLIANTINAANSEDLEWVKDETFASGTRLGFGFDPLSFDGRNKLRTLFGVHSREPRHLMIVQVPDVLRVVKGNGRMLARITGSGYVITTAGVVLSSDGAFNSLHLQ